MILWLTGLPCSGKTTLGHVLIERLKSIGQKAELLDGDEIRGQLWPELGYTELDRNENVFRFGYLARMFARHGIVPVVCTVSPYCSSRDLVRLESTDFLEVFVNAPLAVCEQRDVKGMYFKARIGELESFTGVSSPYEEPLAPEVECFTDLETVDESVSKIISAFRALTSSAFPKETDWSCSSAGDGV